MPESKPASLETPRRPVQARPRPRVNRVRIPVVSNEVGQDEEWFELDQEDGSTRRIRFHDYDQIFQVPGLYEELFHEHLLCRSPSRVRAMLADVLNDFGQDPAALRLLDVGAGNGMVGEELRSLGISTVVGIDILSEARDAALRDRSEVYDDYFAVDLTRLPADIEAKLVARRFNCLSCVAALGVGDIPVAAFLQALELVDEPGLVAFNIKEDFLQGIDSGGFDHTVRDLIAQGVLRVESYRRYRHRLSLTGEPLHYAAIIASKLGSVAAWRREADSASPAEANAGIFTN